MRAWIVWGLFGVAAHLGAAVARAEDPPAQPAAKAEAATEAAVKAEPAAFEPPPGWRPKKRGKFIVYCRKQTEKGTRLPKEVCYDEEGIRAMLAAERDDRQNVDQMRRICSSQAACGSN